MNEEQTKEFRERMEVRIVALLLGEASAFETAELEQALQRDPELAAYHAQMRRTIELTRQASKQFQAASQPAPAPPKLSPERREALLAHFKKGKVVEVPVVRPQPRRRRWLVPASLAAGIVALLSVLSWPHYRGLRRSVSMAMSPGAQADAVQTAREMIVSRNELRSLPSLEKSADHGSFSVTVVPSTRPSEPRESASIAGHSYSLLGPIVAAGDVGKDAPATPTKPQPDAPARTAPKLYLPLSQSGPELATEIKELELLPRAETHSLATSVGGAIQPVDRAEGWKETKGLGGRALESDREKPTIAFTTKPGELPIAQSDLRDESKSKRDQKQFNYSTGIALPAEGAKSAISAGAGPHEGLAQGVTRGRFADAKEDKPANGRVDHDGDGTQAAGDLGGGAGGFGGGRSSAAAVKGITSIDGNGPANFAAGNGWRLFGQPEQGSPMLGDRPLNESLSHDGFKNGFQAPVTFLEGKSVNVPPKNEVTQNTANSSDSFRVGNAEPLVNLVDGRGYLLDEKKKSIALPSSTFGGLSSDTAGRSAFQQKLGNEVNRAAAGFEVDSDTRALPGKVYGSAVPALPPSAPNPNGAFPAPTLQPANPVAADPSKKDVNAWAVTDLDLVEDVSGPMPSAERGKKLAATENAEASRFFRLKLPEGPVLSQKMSKNLGETAPNNDKSELNLERSGARFQIHPKAAKPEQQLATVEARVSQAAESDSKALAFDWIKPPPVAPASLPTPAAIGSPQSPAPGALGSSANKPQIDGLSNRDNPADGEMISPGTMKFQDADVSQVLDAYHELTGRTVVRPNSLPESKITVQTQAPLSRKEAVELADTVLAMNGITMIPQAEKFVKAVPDSTAPTEAALVQDSNHLLDETTHYVTKAVQLKNALPRDVTAALQPLARTTNSIRVIDSSAIVVLRDSEENVKRMEELLQKTDAVAVNEYEPLIIPIKNALASDIAAGLSSLAARPEGATNVANHSALTGISRAPDLQDRLRSMGGGAGSGKAADTILLGQARIIADERSNSLLVFSKKGERDTITNLVAKLEVQLSQNGSNESEIRAKAPKPAASASIPQPEINTRQNAFSTFSLNVSDVSFKLAAASLENSVMPEPASIRVEEFVNAFNYHDPAPAAGARLAFAWERAHYPFAHNRDIVRFAIQTAARGREPQKPLNLVVLLDNSGSMERADRVQIVRESLKVLAQKLQPQDRISVVAFARTARLWVDGMEGGKPKELLGKVLELNPDGGTNLEDALGLGYATATKHFLANGINRVILLTDGAANLGNVEPEVLKQKVISNRIKGIALDCFGIGWEGYNDDLLEVLSHNGDGRYGFLDRPEEAAPEFANQLAGALNVEAADVKTQVEFNPRRVLTWRQIGYAKHQLTKEQFRDNKVDAAELAASESGNALYAIEVNPEGSGPIGTVRVRYKIPATGQYVEQSWPLPYQPKAPALDESSPAMRLAVTAAAFGEWLSRSPYAGEVTPSALQPYLNRVCETYSPDSRPQRLAGMIRQAQAIAGK